jgi:Domain of unknown function (DUF4218)
VTSPEDILNSISATETAQTCISPSERYLLDQTPRSIPKALRTRRDLGDKSPSYISRDELFTIQQDIRNIVVPSWVTRLSPNFGERSNGKVKADEWRSLFQIYLPMTLTHIWTDSNEKWADSKQRALQLKALLALSILVNIVCSRSASTYGSELYQNTLKYYLDLITMLYPSESLVISHHLAVHLPTYMELHGPCHTHWAFPYERLIGRLQKVKHNSRIGKDSRIGVALLIANIR